MFKKVSAYIEKYHMLSAGDTVVTGVSGGADSVCLLLVLSALQKEIPFTLVAVHVNHLIRPDAGRDAAFVKDLCEKCGVPFFLVEKDVEAIAKEKGISTEEAGRQVRYEAFTQVLQQEAAAQSLRGQTETAAAQPLRGQTETATAQVLPGRAKIAVAHNLNDRAETMLFNLFRGSGLTGLGSIRPIRYGGDGPDIIRPLLCVTRAEIEDFLTGMGMSWCIDSTNEEDTYTRNRIRHHILPFAEKEIAGGAVANMGRAADILVETEDFVRQETQKAYRDCVIFGEKTVIKEAGVVPKSSEAASQILSVEHMLSYHPLIQKQVILYCLERLTPAKKDITHIHVEDVLALFLRSGNREIHLPYGITARRSYTKVILEKSSLKCAGGSAVSKDEQAVSYEIELPGLGGEALLVPLPDGSIMEFEAFECEKTINIPQNQYTKWFDYDKIKKPLAIRTRQIGDYLAFNAAFSKKSIQDYMVEEKIPSNERDSIYLLAEEHHILWVTGHRISSFYKINENTKHILQVRLRGGQ